MVTVLPATEQMVVLSTLSEVGSPTDVVAGNEVVTLLVAPVQVAETLAVVAMV